MAEESLRDALEAAYDAADKPVGDATQPAEAGRPAEDASEPVRDTAPTEGSTEPKAADTSGEERGPDEKPVEAKEEVPEKEPPPSTPVSKGPESWKPTAREHWSKLPPEVQAEVNRREKEITQTLQQTAQHRKLAEYFIDTVRPFEAMIRAEGRDPVQSAGELFATAAMLRTGTKAQKVGLVANMIKNFDIDVVALDAALVGQTVTDEESQLAKLLDSRLAPITEFMTKVGEVRRNREVSVESEVQKELSDFASDPKNEFFNDLKEDIADILELASRQKRTMTLQEAYDRAAKLNPQVSQILEQRKKEEEKQKREASSSLPSRGAPPPPSKPDSGAVRDDIEFAIQKVANRV